MSRPNSRPAVWLLLEAVALVALAGPGHAQESDPAAPTASLEDEVTRARQLLEKSAAHIDVAEVEASRRAAVEGIDLVIRLLDERADPDLCELLELLGNRARTAGGLQDAYRAHARSVEVRQRIHEPKDRALTHARARLALTLFYLERHAEARALQWDVLGIYEEILPADDPDLAEARNNMSLILAALGDLRAARALQEAALRVDEKNYPPDHHDLLLSRSNLANLLSSLGDLAAARVLQEAALAGFERTLPEGHPQITRARHNLADMLRQAGDLPAARAIQESVLRDYERMFPAGHPNIITARHNLAMTLGSMGEIRTEEQMLRKVVAEKEEALPYNHRLLLLERSNLANALKRAGQLEEALAILEDVVFIAEESLEESDPRLAGFRAKLADVLDAMGEDEEALRLWQQALDATADLADELWLMSMRSHIGQLAMRVGEDELAIQQLQHLAPELMAFLQGSLGWSSREALERGRAAQWPLDTVLALSRLEGVGSAIAFALVETRRHVSLPMSPDTRSALEPGDHQEKVREIRRQLNDLVVGAQSGESAEDIRDQINSLVRERDRIESEFRQRLVEQESFTRSIEARDVAAALGPGEVAVGYLRYRVTDLVSRDEVDHVLAHVVRPDGTLTRVELGDAAALERRVEQWRHSLGTSLQRGVQLPDEPNERIAGEALRRVLLDPVLEACGRDQGEPTTLLVCADDLVHLVPLDALPVGAGRVGDGLRVVQLLSFAELILPDAPPDSPPGLLALGGANFDGPFDPAPIPSETSRSRPGARFTPLLQTRFEVETVGVLFQEAWNQDPVVLIGKEATKSALQHRVSGTRFLHIATHGWFAPESMRSTIDEEVGPAAWSPATLQKIVVGFAPMTLCGLALAGANRGRDSVGRVPGILTAEELSGFDLSGCELAVLSACETNTGIRRAGQGIHSLQSALHAAGARTAITSLWRVDDAATRRLMEHFYAGLWMEGRSKVEALQSAKRNLRDEGAPLRDWAGWILSGDPE